MREEEEEEEGEGERGSSGQLFSNRVMSVHWMWGRNFYILLFVILCDFLITLRPMQF